MTRRSLPILSAALIAGLIISGLLGAIPLGRAQDLTKPQPELPKEKMTVVTHDGARHDFLVEMATEPGTRQVGEMWRTGVAEDGGMLFDFQVVQDQAMWMRNTLVPLDMLFVTPDGVIRAIAEDAVPRSEALIPSHGPIRVVVELAGGTAAKLDIRVGDRIEQRVFGNAS